MTKEIFVPVKGFERRYRISNHGNIISINGRYLGERQMPCTIDSAGYKSTTLRDNGKKWCVRIHTLVALHFVENPKPGEYDTVNHMDGVKINNHFSNLEWCTKGMNTSHGVMMGLIDQRGEKSKNARLVTSQVLEMRSMYFAGFTQQKIADRFGVGRRHVSDIVNRVCWHHV